MRRNLLGRFCVESAVGMVIASVLLFVALPGLHGTVYEKQFFGWLIDEKESHRAVKLVLFVLVLGLLTGCLQPTIDFLKNRDKDKENASQ